MTTVVSLAATTRTHGRRTGLAVAAGVNGLSALAGAIALATGTIDFGAEINARLPFESLVLAGLALAAIVAVPSLILAYAAWRGDRRTDAFAVLTGTLLIAWIVVQVAVIRSFSWFQPIYLLIGITLLHHGRARGGRIDQLRSPRRS